MKILGIYGSPRKNGNSDLLLDKILDEAELADASVSRLYIRKLSMIGCIECGKCEDTGKCVIDDDMTGVYPMLVKADAIVLAAPVFFYNFPAITKALIDRVQALWALRMLKKGKGAAYKGGSGYVACVGATKGKNLFNGIKLTAKYFFDAMDMEYKGGIFFRRIEEKGAILKHADAMDKARGLGRKIAAGT